jgi:hypothetical protein
MDITLVLNENDYLTYQLYTASKKKGVINNRRKSWLILSGSFLVLGFMFMRSNKFYAYYFLGAGVITLIFYPFYQRFKYKKHYQKFIADNYKYRFGKESRISLLPDFIHCQDITGESKTSTKEIEQIDEISTHYFVKIKSGESLIIPKREMIEDVSVSKLTAIFQNPNIIINKELDWKWK